MIVNKQTVQLYNEIFEFLGKQYGTEAIEKFCDQIREPMVGDLIRQYRRYGLPGAGAYWLKTLWSEGAKFELTYNNIFELLIRIEVCPSLEKLGSKASCYYCQHCQYLYPPIFSEKHNVTIARSKRGCTIAITPKPIKEI